MLFFVLLIGAKALALIVNWKVAEAEELKVQGDLEIRGEALLDLDVLSSEGDCCALSQEEEVEVDPGDSLQPSPGLLHDLYEDVRD